MRGKKLGLSVEYDQLQNMQCYNILRLLQENNHYFSVICELKHVSFEPMLPKDIIDAFQPISMFVVAGYAFDSLSLGTRGMSFEAGFGMDNIGACVQIDYAYILQIAVVNKKDRDVALFSRIDSIEIFGGEMQDIHEDGLSRSMEAILSHPHNQKFFT